MFTTSIICAVVNEKQKIALLRQNYVSTTSYVCVAGIMMLGYLEKVKKVDFKLSGEEYYTTS